MFARPLSIQVSGLHGLHDLNGFAVPSTKNPSVGCQADGTCLQAVLARIPSQAGKSFFTVASQRQVVPLIDTFHQTGVVSPELFAALEQQLNLLADGQPSESRAYAAQVVSSEIIPALQALMTGAPATSTGVILPTVATTLDTVSNLWDKLTGKTPATTPGANPTSTGAEVVGPTGSLANTLATSPLTKTSNIVMALGAVAILGGLLVYLRKRKARGVAGLGHPGMLTRAGCHRNHRTGRVHCHQPRGYQTGGGRGKKTHRKSRR